MRIPRPGERPLPQEPLALGVAQRLIAAAGPILEDATDVQWYDAAGNDVDRAALTLCRLRRVMASRGGGPEYGDAAVRAILAKASPEALIWFASRAVSYLDENGFPDAVAPWFPDEHETD